MKKFTASLLALTISQLSLGCDKHSHEADGHDHHDSGDGHGDEEHHDEAAEHEHSADAIGITRFSEKLELFAEHPPAVTGQDFEFLAHLTILDGFKALDKATVTLILDGPTHLEAEVKNSIRPGIFKPALKAPAPGKYQASVVVVGQDLNDTIQGFEITVYPSEKAAHEAQPQEANGPEPMSFLKEQQWQIPFATAFAQSGSIVPMIEAAGEVTTPPAGQAEVGATISGRLSAPPQGLPHPGQLVKKGELLATLSAAPAAPEDAARAGLAVIEAEARLEAARAALERAERLIADRAISKREVDEATRELKVAEQAVGAAQSARSVFTNAASGGGAGSFRLVAPMDGTIVEMKATPGKSVVSGELLFRIVNFEQLWLKARVPEQGAASLRSDQDAAYRLSGESSWHSLQVTGETPDAKVVNVGRVVDPRSRTVEVIYALLAPDPSLRVGAMVRVAVPSGALWQGVIVPHEAILNENGRSVVYVQLEGEAFAERTVTLGPRSGASTGVVSGLTKGERVVTRGANVVRLSSRTSTTPAHGHVH